jgi:hypothetical protein
LLFRPFPFSNFNWLIFESKTSFLAIFSLLF